MDNPNKVRRRYLKTIRSLINRRSAGPKHVVVPGPLQVSKLAITDQDPLESLTLGHGYDETASLPDDSYHGDALARFDRW
jgi:hypothetical protein